MVQVDSFDIVAMWLVKEKLRGNSRFNGYFASLPDEFSTPLCTPRRDWILLPKQVKFYNSMLLKKISQGPENFGSGSRRPGDAFSTFTFHTKKFGISN